MPIFTSENALRDAISRAGGTLVGFQSTIDPHRVDVAVVNKTTGNLLHFDVPNADETSMHTFEKDVLDAIVDDNLRHSRRVVSVRAEDLNEVYKQLNALTKKVHDLLERKT